MDAAPSLRRLPVIRRFLWEKNCQIYVHVFFRRRTGLCLGGPVGSYLGRQDRLHPGWAGGIVTLVLKRLHPRPPILLRPSFGKGLGTWNRLHQHPHVSLRLLFGEALGTWNRLHQPPQVSLRLSFEKRGGIAFAFHRRIERLTMLEYRRKLSACHPTLLRGAWVSRAKLALYLALRSALRARLFCRYILIDCSV